MIYANKFIYCWFIFKAHDLDPHRKHITGFKTSEDAPE